MKIYDLSDDSCSKAWQRYVELENDWREDPANKEKFSAARKAYDEYDAARIKFYNLPDE